MEIYKFQINNYTIREETLHGVPHIVVPVVMLVEGVHDGSLGPILHLPEEFAKVPESWDGIPITLNHPRIDGEFVSANSPGVLDDVCLGRIFHTQFNNGKLKSEAWIDVNAAERLAPEILQKLRRGELIEVSTGVFADNENNPGEWSGEQYQVIAHDHKPDHLALLPNETGACSIQDGCGLGALKERGGEMKKEKLLEVMKDLKKDGLTVNEVVNGLTANVQSFGQIMSQIQRKLDNMDDDTKLHFLEEVFDDFFIFTIRSRGVGESMLMRRSYVVNDQDVVEFTGEATPVVRQVEFVDLEETANNQEGVKRMVKRMANKKDKKTESPNKDKVDFLIQCENCNFEESDREYLSAQSEEKLDGFIPEQKPDENKPTKTATDTTGDNTPAANAEAKTEAPKTTAQYLQEIPEELREQMQHGLSLVEAEKTKLISHITANSEKGIFAEGELQKKDIKELKKLASLVKAPVDFSGNGPTQPDLSVQTGGDGVLLPMNVKMAQDKEKKTVH